MDGCRGVLHLAVGRARHGASLGRRREAGPMGAWPTAGATKVKRNGWRSFLRATGNL